MEVGSVAAPERVLPAPEWSLARRLALRFACAYFAIYFASFPLGLIPWLFYRRTTTLGALILVGVMPNVVALNFFFDTPVKLYSSHLLAASGFLALPDAGRLWNVLVANRATVPAPRSVARRCWVERLRPWVATAFLGWLLYTQTRQGLEWYRGFGDGRPRTELHGSYEVVAHAREDEPLAPDHPERWRSFSFGVRGRCTARRVDGQVLIWQFEPAASGATVRLFANQPSDGVELETVWNDAEHLDLAGELDGALVVVQMKKKSFLFETRGFHWVNEYPFNR